MLVDVRFIYSEYSPKTEVTWLLAGLGAGTAGMDSPFYSC